MLKIDEQWKKLKMKFSEISSALCYTLEKWGINCLYGVTGGGLLELIKHLPQ